MLVQPVVLPGTGALSWTVLGDHDADYLHGEYGGIDSSFVFVNLFAEPRGHAWSYPAVYNLVLRLRAKTGIDFDPHWFRHSWVICT